jgi:SAM-dependent methyltransferase
MAMNIREVGDVSVEAGRASSQMGWYRYAADNIVNGKTVLDVGCGLGSGLEALREAAKEAHGQDLDPRLKRDGVVIGPLSEIGDLSYDVVVCIDVVEHVEDDRGFIKELSRIARDALFLTTPLSCWGRKVWPYHVREYRAREFRGLLPDGELTYMIGTPSGDERYEVRTRWFSLLDRAINFPPTNLPVRAAQKLLPRRLRYNAHQAVLVRFLPAAAADLDRIATFREIYGLPHWREAVHDHYRRSN